MAANFDGKWELVKAGGVAYPAGTVFTFENGHYHYPYGNQHSGSYQVDGSNINLGPGMSTLMMTYLNPPEHELEGHWSSSKTWAIQGDHLIFKDGAGHAIVELKKAH